jgi:hypothetical protein
MPTGWLRIKFAQIRGKGHGLARRLNLFRDPVWSDWLPSYAWLIDHPEGPILIDTGQGRHLLEHGSSWHLEAGRVDSLYFALPTRAVAVQLQDRVTKIMGRLFGDGVLEPVLAYVLCAGLLKPCGS